ncbi:MAG: DNA-formamidopyrimidine glycosylase [Deltaproteobacteria bacterium]|nr:DNA-formamidopyrimidine glycosylase [Deltaproteobacteria bacterium]MBW2052287.1 DNA-formamidopyrimidine glycosylase [Deltaproteobacteria bacterium]MBW2140607.1 DNA-formamidopyrimidine glycosylase [Deltaproteobacteria bacterium]MBW2322763.1 DNA-formamidopyrimidine glycosylase [Deltaproteobacteria bacterium]
MPELPEVETIVRDLQALLVGRRADWIRVRLNKIVKTGPRRLGRLLTGARVQAVKRRGKFIIIEFNDERYLVIHLKMTGQFLWQENSNKWPKHVHVIIGFDDGGELLYRDIRQFGYFMGFSSSEYITWQKEKPVGPDPFEINEENFARLLKNRRGRIKPLLLNQLVISGLGNIYVDESLFAVGIHPLTPAESIDEEQARRLHKEIIRILNKAIELKGSTIANYRGVSGRGGEFQKRHQVYHQQGEPCPICSNEIKRTVVGSRGTYFCPNCQKL